MLEAIYLIASLIGIMVSSYVFTENIENVLKSRGFSMRTIGSVIAPLFTSAPELIIILISLFILSKNLSKEVISGVVLGEPFTVLSMGFFLFSIAMINVRTREDETIESKVLFLYIAISSITILLGMLIPYGNYVSAIFLILIYAFATAKNSKRTDKNIKEDVKEVGEYNHPFRVLFIALSAILLTASSYFLLRSIEEISKQLMIPTFYASLILIPIGTILPELMNSIFWGRKGKLELALGNLGGESFIFITIYPALALLTGFFYYSFGTYILTITIIANAIFFYLITRFFKNYVRIFSSGLLFYVLYIFFSLITK